MQDCKLRNIYICFLPFAVRGGLFSGVFVVVLILVWWKRCGCAVMGVAGLGRHQYRESMLSKVQSVE